MDAAPVLCSYLTFVLENMTKDCEFLDIISLEQINIWLFSIDSLLLKKNIEYIIIQACYCVILVWNLKFHIESRIRKRSISCCDRVYGGSDKTVRAIQSSYVFLHVGITSSHK